MFWNEVKLIGNLGGDATEFTFADQKAKVSFSLATQRSWKNKDTGEYETRTDWHRIVVYGGLVKFAKTLKKGERILVSGELRSRDYDKEVGKGKSKQDVTMYVTEVFAIQIRRMDKRKESDPIDPESEASVDEDVPF